jgi:hypothetical protein
MACARASSVVGERGVLCECRGVCAWDPTTSAHPYSSHISPSSESVGISRNQSIEQHAYQHALDGECLSD